ncbi:hypothetical protein M0802_004217 [Mischocyttarus mexicanus]|nr:hypothetical protein M0802_004217 [Mischocyttarus mexicanus]
MDYEGPPSHPPAYEAFFFVESKGKQSNVQVWLGRGILIVLRRTKEQEERRSCSIQEYAMYRVNTTVNGGSKKSSHSYKTMLENEFHSYVRIFDGSITLPRLSIKANKKGHYCILCNLPKSPDVAGDGGRPITSQAERSSSFFYGTDGNDSILMTPINP